MAGASKELQEAILVNPNDLSSVVSAIKEALVMDKAEQVARISAMQESLKRYDIFQWVKVFMDRLEDVKDKQRQLQSKSVDKSIAKKLRESFRGAQRRILFLDYDGTLVGFTARPEDAYPNKEIRGLIAD